MRGLLLGAAWVAMGLGCVAAAAQEAAIEPTGRAIVQRDAAAVGAIAESALAKEFLRGAAELPSIETRTFFVDPATRVWMTSEDAAKLPEEQRATLKSRACDETFYYLTRYGTPAAYVRAFDVLQRIAPEFASWQDKQVLDFGYGTVGHLRMLAAAGARCAGVDVDSLLPLLYGDAGSPAIAGGGSVRVLAGQWPAEPKLVEQVGIGYDLFISKNTLKNGYVNPEQKVDPRGLVHLGVSNDLFVANLARIVKPGGYVLIYNICPAPAAEGEAYIPWADGRCPFPREMWERHGFDVKAFDVNDDDAVRAMGRKLGWDRGKDGGVDPGYEKNFFGMYSVMRRRE